MSVHSIVTARSSANRASYNSVSSEQRVLCLFTAQLVSGFECVCASMSMYKDVYLHRVFLGGRLLPYTS